MRAIGLRPRSTLKGTGSWAGVYSACLHCAAGTRGSRKSPKPACPGGLGLGKLLKNAADWASEPQANIAHPKRMSAGDPTRPLHYPGDRPGRFVGRFSVYKALCFFTFLNRDCEFQSSNRCL